jgi:sugar lactone lactonase YvrE
MKRFSILAAFIAAALFSSQAPAAKVKVWQHTGPKDFDKAQFKQAVVTSEGTLRLARQLRPLANLEVAHAWDIVEDRAGNLWVATGDDGKIFKVTPDGNAKAVYVSSTESQILSLAITSDGTLFAGTGPNGKIIRVGADGQTKVFAENLDSYVWSLAFDPSSQSLYAGTGPKGKVYQVTADGKASVYYATKQEHILALAIDKKSLYAGTDKGGLVYRIDAPGKGFVVYHAHQAEVRSLLVADGALYAGTASAIVKRPTGTTPFRPMPGGSPPMGTPTFTPAEQKAKGGGKSVQTPGALGAAIGSEETKGIPAAAPSNPVIGDNSLYRINPDGTVRELFRDKIMVLALLRHHGRLLVGTGMQGQLFEIDEATKEKTELARLDHGQVHCLLQRKDGSIVLGAGDPGKLYVLEDKFSAKGTLTSDVLDAKIISTWGAMNWNAVSPNGTAASVAVRSGNVADPDETWSRWSAEQANMEGAKALAPTARYLQFRVTLSTKDPAVTPEFRRLAVRYKTTNQAPEITSFDVPDLDANPQESPKKFRLRWNATDPNEDELTFSLHFKKDGWKEWVLLEDNLDKNNFEWDTTTIPSGLYQFKVTASDRRDNSPEETKTAERTSPLIPVTHLPPVVTVKLAGFDGDQAILEATATDPLVRLTEAAFSVDGKRWSNIFPMDGLFDSKSETFRFKTDALRPGAHILVLRVRNAAGNLGSGDVTFAMERK